MIVNPKAPVIAVALEKIQDPNVREAMRTLLRQIEDVYSGIARVSNFNMARQIEAGDEPTLGEGESVFWLDSSDSGQPVAFIKAKINGRVVTFQAATVTEPEQPPPPPPPPPPDEEPPPDPGDPLPTGNIIPVATFQSISIYWTPPSNPGLEGVTVEYKRAVDNTWIQGHPLWFDDRNGQCRGSIVNLQPKTEYNIRLSMPSEAPSVGISVTTWDDVFPEGAVTQLPASSNQMLQITQSGSAAGYRVYEPAGAAATIDVNNAQDTCVRISGSFIILRGVTLRGARIDGIQIMPGATDIVIEGCDISGWGRPTTATRDIGYPEGRNEDSAISCRGQGTCHRIVIQKNRIHDPRYGASSWDFGHPSGPNGVLFVEAGDNHVFRWNDIVTEDPHHFLMDAFGGAQNHSLRGFPGHDTDIYENMIRGVMDDGIEAEGGGRNVRIWGNYIDFSMICIATTSITTGPTYIWRNVFDRSRHFYTRTWDNDDRGDFGKTGSTTGSFGHGRRYVYHNTMLQRPPTGEAGVITWPLGGSGGLAGPGGGQDMDNTKARNNIWWITKNTWFTYENASAATNDLNYSLYNGVLGSVPSGTEANGQKMTGSVNPNGPVWEAGHGPTGPMNGTSTGRYQLAAGALGHDDGEVIPNFNDGFEGAAPDIGAHERGSADMKFGIAAAP